MLAISLLCSCVRYNPEDLKASTNYISINESIGILTHPNGVAPEMVLSQTYAVTMLTDERILGQWTLNGQSTNIILLKDGSAQTALKSTSLKNGKFVWATGNILIITYDDLTYDVLKFDILEPDKNLAIIAVELYGELESVAYLGQRREGTFQLSSFQTTDKRIK